MVDVVAFTELVCEGQAGQVLQPVPVDRVNVKPNDERGEQPGVDHHRDGDEDALPVLVEVPEGDVGQEGEGEQQAAEETEDVGDVVDPRQEAAQEEEEDDAQQLEEGFPRLLQDLPTLKQLDKQAGEESKLRPRWTHLEGEEQRKVESRREDERVLLYSYIENENGHSVERIPSPQTLFGYLA